MAKVSNAWGMPEGGGGGMLKLPFDRYIRKIPTKSAIFVKAAKFENSQN